MSYAVTALEICSVLWLPSSQRVQVCFPWTIWTSIKPQNLWSVSVCSDRHSPDLQWKRFFFKKRELFTFYCLRAPHYYTFNIVSYKANSLTVMHSLFRCYIELLVVTAETVKGLYTRWEFRTQAGQFCLQKNWWWN